jgi:hypothetical protein
MDIIANADDVCKFVTLAIRPFFVSIATTFFSGFCEKEKLAARIQLTLPRLHIQLIILA